MDNQIKYAPTLANLYTHRAEILRVAGEYGVSNVRVFGSVARNEATDHSDIDLLVDFPAHFSLLDLSALVQDLQQLLGYPVQVASASHLRADMRSHILQDARPL